MICTFCGVERGYVFRAGVPGVAICPQCATQSSLARCDTVTEATICAFCGKPPRKARLRFLRREVALLGVTPDSLICSQCMYVVHGHFRFKGFTSP